MIRDEEVFYIGKVSKWRGICGDVEILFTDDAFDRGDAEYLVLEMDGILDSKMTRRPSFISKI